MRKCLLNLLFVIITSVLQAATIYVNVRNVNGTLVSGAYVKLYNNSWSLIKTGYTNSSGEVTFALLDYGIYNYEVYYTGDAQEFWGSVEGVNIQSPTLTSNFTRYWPYRYSYNTPSASVYTNNQVTYSITVKNNVSFSRNVKVVLWVDRDKSSTWDYYQTSSVQSISSNGTRTFTFNFVPTVAGTYYWKMHILTYNDGAGAYIVTDSYSWTNSFTANDQLSDLDIYVKNVNGNLVENAYVKLYDENWNFEDDDYTNSLGRADFNDLSYGTYNYEVYNTGDVVEYWGGGENVNINSASEAETFTRNWPYRSNFITSVDNSATYEITVRNDLSFSRNVKVEIWADRNQSTSGDFHRLSDPQLIGGNSNKTFTFSFTPVVSGTYYYKMHILTYNDGAGKYIVTDSYLWTQSFTINISNPFPLSDGILMYHIYSKYLAVPIENNLNDGNIFLYDFNSKSLQNLTIGSGVVNAMNPHSNPDGNIITFMGIPADKAEEIQFDSENNYWHRLWNNLEIYTLELGSNAIKRLTNNNIADEDPKFSPDGANIIFKQNGDIKLMNLDGTNIISLSNDGMSIEESMPYLSLNSQKVLYNVGVKENADIYIMNYDGTNKSPLIDENGVFEYYPVIKDETSFFYTRWISSTNHNDQIYLSDLSGNTDSLSINDVNSNNSDPYPVGTDYLFFSSTRSESIGGYDLFLGQISTGEIWSLNDFSINSALEDIGACYISHQTFNINVNANPANGGGINGGGSYEKEKICSLIATAGTGYDFVNWTENGTQVSTNATYSFVVTSNRNLIANFKAQVFNVSVNANPSNGGSISGGGSYNYGQTCTLVAIAGTGYSFVNWTENGAQVSSDANYSFTVSSNHNLVANFQTQVFNVSVNANPSNGNSISGGGSYSYGQTCTLVATAGTGYIFENWTENGTQVSTDATYSFDVISNRNFVANFKNQVFNVSVNANPSNGGSISGGGSYSYGQTCALVATAGTGYVFENWTENGAQVSENANYSFTVSSDRDIVANFENTTHIDELNKEYSVMTVFPNPSNKGVEIAVVINLTYDILKECQLSVTSINGSVIKSFNGFDSKLTVSDLDKGVYLFNLVRKGKTICVKKVVVQ